MDTKIHDFEKTLHENYFVPPHPPRTESEGYKKLLKKLHNENFSCIVCGLHYNDIKNPTINKIGATNIECHHKVVEWAWHTVADQNKVGSDYPQVIHMTRQEFLNWLDHSEDIAMGLCDIHHRHRDMGIHEVDEASFNLVKYLQDDFNLVDNNPE